VAAPQETLRPVQVPDDIASRVARHAVYDAALSTLEARSSSIAAGLRPGASEVFELRLPLTLDALVLPTRAPMDFWTLRHQLRTVSQQTRFDLARPRADLWSLRQKTAGGTGSGHDMWALRQRAMGAGGRTPDLWTLRQRMLDHWSTPRTEIFSPAERFQMRLMRSAQNRDIFFEYATRRYFQNLAETVNAGRRVYMKDFPEPAKSATRFAKRFGERYPPAYDTVMQHRWQARSTSIEVWLKHKEGSLSFSQQRVSFRYDAPGSFANWKRMVTRETALAAREAVRGAARGLFHEELNRGFDRISRNIEPGHYARVHESATVRVTTEHWYERPRISFPFDLFPTREPASYRSTTFQFKTPPR